MAEPVNYPLHFDGLPEMNIMPAEHTRPCMQNDRKALPCRPADCPAHRCSAWQRWDADQRRIGLRRWAAAAVEAELAEEEVSDG